MSNRVPCAALLALAVFCAPPARTQPEPPLAWGKRFPYSIEWFVRTSSGILLVRSGKTLFAIDGKDGTDFWSKGLDIDGPRGTNLFEIPGTPLLLTKRVHGSGEPPESTLLAVNLRTGAERALGTTRKDLAGVLPFYLGERFLLLTAPTIRMIAPTVEAELWPMSDPQFEKPEWRAKWTGAVGLEFAVFELPEAAYLYTETREMRSSMKIERLDLEKRASAWKFEKKYWEPGSPPWPIFVGGRFILAGKEVFAVDSATGKPAWVSDHLGWIAALVPGSGVVFATGQEGAFALDLATGAVRWRVESKGNASGPLWLEKNNSLVFADEAGVVAVEASSGKILWRVATDGNPTNAVLLERDHALVFCDRSGLVVVDPAGGQVLRRKSLDLKWQPEFIRTKGPHLLAVLAAEKPRGAGGWLKLAAPWGSFGWAWAIYDAASLEKIGMEEPAAWFAPFTTLAGSRVPEVGAVEPSPWLKANLEKAWTKLQQRAALDPAWQAFLERVERALHEESRGAVYARRVQKGQWKLYRVDRVANLREEWLIPGEQPDVLPGFGLAFAVAGNTLRAFRLERKESAARR